MKHTIISFLIVCVFATLYGCSDNVSDYHVNSVKMEIKRLKKESKENPYDFSVHLTSMYDSELGYINRKDRLWQDNNVSPYAVGLQPCNALRIYARPFCSPATPPRTCVRWECRGTTLFCHCSGNKN